MLDLLKVVGRLQCPSFEGYDWSYVKMWNFEKRGSSSEKRSEATDRWVSEILGDAFWRLSVPTEIVCAIFIPALELKFEQKL